MRSALTALGVIIGVGAVIAMTGIGQGASPPSQKTIASMGANNLIMLSRRRGQRRRDFGGGSRPRSRPRDGGPMPACPSISAWPPWFGANPVSLRPQQLEHALRVGTTPPYLDVRDWQDLEEGDVFSDRDVLNANKVCMIGTTLKRKLFDNESPVGKEMRISNVGFRVIGVLCPRAPT